MWAVELYGRMYDRSCSVRFGVINDGELVEIGHEAIPCCSACSSDLRCPAMMSVSETREGDDPYVRSKGDVFCLYNVFTKKTKDGNVAELGRFIVEV